MQLCKFIVLFTQYQPVSLLKSLSSRGLLFPHQDAYLEIMLLLQQYAGLTLLLEEMEGSLLWFHISLVFYVDVGGSRKVDSTTMGEGP